MSGDEINEVTELLKGFLEGVANGFETAAPEQSFTGTEIAVLLRESKDQVKSHVERAVV